MSNEKLYVVKNDEGKYLTIEHMALRWSSQVGTTVRNINVAVTWAVKHGGHVVTLIDEPKKVALSKEHARIVEEAHNAKWPAKYITDYTDNGNESERLLMEAFVNGYTMTKDKKYRVKVPHVPLHYWKMPDGELGIDNLDATISYGEDISDFEFTELDIEHYNLQDCEKEEVIDDDE